MFNQANPLNSHQVKPKNKKPLVNQTDTRGI